MFKELIKTKEWIIDILMPKKCLGCSHEGQYICQNCEIFLSEVDLTNLSQLNMNETGSQANIMSVWEYEGLMEKLIQKIKHDGCYDIVSELVATAFKKIDLNLPEDTIITFVPMYKKKEKRRGFNQSELIAKGVGEAINKPVVKLLEKVKDNQLQAGLNLRERIENVKNVFTPLSKVSPKTILLVDDFCATGATIKECTSVLKSNGAKDVFGFTLARQSAIKAKLSL